MLLLVKRRGDWSLTRPMLLVPGGTHFHNEQDEGEAGGGARATPADEAAAGGADRHGQQPPATGEYSHNFTG